MPTALRPLIISNHSSRHTKTFVSASSCRLMEEPAGVPRRSGRLSSYERPLAIIITIIAVLSPLYIDRRSAEELELEEDGLGFSLLLPLLVLVVTVVIVVSCYLDQDFMRFDPNWIHRVGGSSGGIIVILTVLVLVIKCKASFSN